MATGGRKSSKTMTTEEKSTSTKKMRDFLSEPLEQKEIGEVPGCGKLTERILKQHKYYKVSRLTSHTVLSHKKRSQGPSKLTNKTNSDKYVYIGRHTTF